MSNNKPSIGSAFGSILSATVAIADAAGKSVNAVGDTVPVVVAKTLGSVANGAELMYSNTIAWKSESSMKQAIADLLDLEVKAALNNEDSSDITARRKELEAKCQELFN